MLEFALRLFVNTFLKSKIKNMNNSWKTNIAGILIALVGLFTLVTNCLNGDCDWNAIITAVTALVAAFGFLASRDNDKTSEDAGLK